MSLFTALVPPLLALPAPLESAMEFFQKGGLFMVPLGLCSIAAVTIVLLRAFALRREAVLPGILISEIERMPTGAGKLEVLARLAGGDPSALARLIRVVFAHRRWTRAENTEAVQVAARREILRLESGLGVLELIVGIAPLLGLLGAIAGLVRVFSNLGTGKLAADTLGVALGIAEALNTTIFGLAIAIPTLVAYTYFTKKVEFMSVEMESLLADLVTKCYYQRSARPAGGTAPSTAAEAQVEDDEEPEEAMPTPVARRPRVDRA